MNRRTRLACQVSQLPEVEIRHDLLESSRGDQTDLRRLRMSAVAPPATVNLAGVQTAWADLPPTVQQFILQEMQNPGSQPTPTPQQGQTVVTQMQRDGVIPPGQNPTYDQVAQYLAQNPNAAQGFSAASYMVTMGDLANAYLRFIDNLGSLK